MKLGKSLLMTLVVSAGISSAAWAGPLPDAVIAKVNATIDADAPRLIEIFKDLHQHPELGFTETRTAAIVAKELEALGFEVTTGVGLTAPHSWLVSS